MPRTKKQTVDSLTADSKKTKFKIVIYANQMLRASYPAMTNIALEILKNKRSSEIEKKIISIKKILNIIPPVE